MKTHMEPNEMEIEQGIEKQGKARKDKILLNIKVALSWPFLGHCLIGCFQNKTKINWPKMSYQFIVTVPDTFIVQECEFKLS